MFLSLLLVAFAHGDYFETERRFQAEDAERARLAADAKQARDTADHNDKISRFAEAVGAKLGGGYNYVSTPCERICRMYHRNDWIVTITFDTQRGYQCYARVFDTGHEYHCVNPQTRDHIDVDTTGRSTPETPAKRPRRRG